MYGETHSHTHTHTSASHIHTSLLHPHTFPLHTHTHTHTHTQVSVARTHISLPHAHTLSLSHVLQVVMGVGGASQKGSVCVRARYPPHLMLHLAATATPANVGLSDSWTVISHKRCANTKHGGSFSTLTAAQAFCLKQGSSACSGVYDDHCDGKGSFLACKLGGFASSSMGSCIYTTDIKGWFMVKYCFLCWHACAHS